MATMTVSGQSGSNGLGYTGAKVGSSLSTKGALDGEQDELEIRIEFGGGLHLLFSSNPKHTIRVPRLVPGTTPPKQIDMRFLIRWLKGNLLSEREEMFGDGDGVRPGILVLINDADWELEGELDYELKPRDEVVFISTLHGG
ncbi:MAG: Ubiquitin- modifier 1 [Tremellales sp. Tagirdzhanova-0007]|nr:MAG: Ubiquitin- modifier 1 [Tremellales sp. Tagirdzhanova-0007]